MDQSNVAPTSEAEVSTQDELKMLRDQLAHANELIAVMKRKKAELKSRTAASKARRKWALFQSVGPTRKRLVFEAAVRKAVRRHHLVSAGVDAEYMYFNDDILINKSNGDVSRLDEHLCNIIKDPLEKHRF